MAEVSEDGTDRKIHGDIAVEDFNNAVFDRTIPHHFINETYIEVNEDEVTMAFLHSSRTPNGRKLRPMVRLTLTHSTFLKMMAFFNKRADFLLDVYDGFPTTAYDADPEVFSQALDRMNKRVEDEEDEVKEVKEDE